MPVWSVVGARPADDVLFIAVMLGRFGLAGVELVDLMAAQAGTLRVEGFCPMGCGETLFVAEGGYVTCSWHECPNPGALALLLADPLISEHVVTFGEEGFDVQHPLSERGQDLVACELHQHLRALDGPPIPPGRFAARKRDGRWTWSPLS